MFGICLWYSNVNVMKFISFICQWRKLRNIWWYVNCVQLKLWVLQCRLEWNDGSTWMDAGRWHVVECSSRVCNVCFKKAMSHHRWRCNVIRSFALANAHCVQVVKCIEEANVEKTVCHKCWHFFLIINEVWIYDLW